MYAIGEEVATEFDRMTNKELGNWIRGELKKLGISSRQVSVRVRPCGYSTDVRCEIKDLSVDYETVKNIATRVGYIRYDPYAQEILSGCNTFVNIDYDYEVMKKARDENIEETKELLKGCETQSKTVLETEEGKYVIIPSHHSDGKNEWFTYSYTFFKNGENIGKHIGEFRNLYDCAWDLADKLAIHKARTAA